MSLVEKILYKNGKFRVCSFGVALAGLIGLVLAKKHFNGAVCRIRRDLSGKVAIVTGANTGIGRETAVQLVSMGATVVLACRSRERTQGVLDQIERQFPQSRAVFIELDLSDLDSVRRFVAEFTKQFNRLDFLINNGGIMSLPQRKVSAQGYELQFATNHLGHFLLTNLLFDHLKKSQPARVISVSSKLHLRSEFNGAPGFNFDDLQLAQSYSPRLAYAQSKLANVVFAKYLQKIYKREGLNILSVSVHPGVVRTELGRHMFGSKLRQLFFRIFIYPLFYLLTKSSLYGAQTTLYCVLADESELEGGGYYADCARAQNLAVADDE